MLCDSSNKRFVVDEVCSINWNFVNLGISILQTLPEGFLRRMYSFRNNLWSWVKPEKSKVAITVDCALCSHTYIFLAQQGYTMLHQSSKGNIKEHSDVDTEHQQLIMLKVLSTY